MPKVQTVLNSENISIDEARELVSDRELWPRVRDFLWDFAPLVHESWIGDVPPGKPDAGSGGDSAASGLASRMDSPRVRRFVLDALGVEPCFHSFPKDDWSRLALLDGATLLEMAKWTGAVACADSLRRITGGKAVRELKASLPGIYPDVFGYSMYFKKLQADGLKIERAGEIPEIGLSMLLSFLSGLDGRLRHRMLLKLPKDLQPSKLQLPNLQPSNLQLLLKLRFPEAHSLCC